MATLITLVDGTIPVAADFNSNFTAINSEIRPATTGGTGQASYAIGDVLYASAVSTLTRLAAGSTGLVLTMVAGVPVWGSGNAGSPGVFGLTGTNNAATPTSKYDLLASYVTLRNPTTGSIRTVVPTSLTNDIAAATTANGRDQVAAFTASTWVYFYYVGTGTGQPTTRSSASPTGPTLLSGETEWALATAVFNNATPRLVATVARGANVFYQATQSLVAAGTATTQATVSMTSMIPPIAFRSRLNVAYANDAGAGSGTASVRYITATDYFTIVVTATDRNTTTVELPNVAQTLFYILTTAFTTFDIDVLGYTLPNGDG